jgi:hypothetical protein
MDFIYPVATHAEAAIQNRNPNLEIWNPRDGDIVASPSQVAADLEKTQQFCWWWS